MAVRVRGPDQITKEDCQSSRKPIRSTATRRTTSLFKGAETRHFIGKGAGRGAQHRLALWPRGGSSRQQAAKRGGHVLDRVPLVLAALALGVLASLVLGHKLAVERQEAIAQLLLQLGSELRRLDQGLYYKREGRAQKRRLGDDAEMHLQTRSMQAQ